MKLQHPHTGGIVEAVGDTAKTLLARGFRVLEQPKQETEETEKKPTRRTRKRR